MGKDYYSVKCVIVSFFSTKILISKRDAYLEPSRASAMEL